MHGLILAGGEGSRLAASGVTTPKALVPVGGVPQLVRLARVLERVGCASLTCLVREGVILDPVTDDLARLRVPVTVHTCSTPSSLHTLVWGLAAAPAGDILCTMVDTVMPFRDWDRLHTEARSALGAGADAVLAVTPWVDDERPLYVARDASGGVREVTDRRVEPPLVTGGVYAFGSRARALAPVVLAEGHARMRAFLAVLVARGLRVRAVEIARIVDLDHRHDLEAANAWQESCDDEEHFMP